MTKEIIDLEIKLTFQEQLVDELNKIMIVQQRQLDKLSMKMTLLENRIKSGEGMGNEISNPPPPHH